MRHIFPLLSLIFIFCSQVANAQPPAPTLQLQGDAYPRVFFFRQSELAAAGRGIPFEEWDKNFSRLMGIMGKSLDEEVPGRSRNIEFFTRFKQTHPEQTVLLHFNGNARDPRWESQRFFAGHWLYYNGAKILSAMSADEAESVLQVSDASLFQTNIGRDKNSNDDIGLCLLGSDGRPNWNESEQVQLLSVDRANKTIRVRRGCYGSTARAFPAGKAYAAAHCTEGPWGKNSHLLWFYNYATTCPKDAHGQSCADILAAQLSGLFGTGGTLAAFDGLEFDVLYNSCPAARSTFGPDCDADGQVDGGVVNGVNVYGAGVVEFCRQLRAKLGETRIIQADGATPKNVNQRAFGLLNGIESEGWPDLSDQTIQNWSGGLNRHFFWSQNARPPVFNYINHKFISPGVKPGEEKQSDVPFNIHRLVFAAGVFTDSAICYSSAPDGDKRTLPIWDEFIMGAANRLGWLGKPMGPAVHLAMREPDLLRGAGMPVSEAFLRRLESDEARIELDHGAIKLTGKNPDAPQFRVRIKNLPCSGPDLFVSLTARGAPLKGQPQEMARLMYAGVGSAANRLVQPDPLPITGMARRGGMETPLDPGSHAAVNYQASIKLSGDMRPAYFVHPPYTGGATGYTFWERRVSVPQNGELKFDTGISINGATKGDGVTFIVQAAPERDGQAGEFKEIFRAHEKTSLWTPHTVSLAQWAGQAVWLKFISDCGPNDNATADQSYWSSVRVMCASGRGEEETPAVQFSTWVNAKKFQSGFYYNDVRSRQVDLEFLVESSEPIWISDIAAYAHPDAMFREFEHGLVVANPSPRPYTFDLAQLFPGKKFRRIQASVQQDTQANNGERVTERLTLGPQDALFLSKE